jgi:drug/metabolite transporter (DMT)-like permease
VAEQLKIRDKSDPLSGRWAAMGALFVGIAAVACAAIFVKISTAEIGPIATISNRLWIATLPLSGWVGVMKLRDSGESSGVTLKLDDWGLLVFAGVIAAVDLPLWAFSLTRTSVANAMVLSDMAPLFTTLGAWLLWRQRFDGRFLLGLAVSLAGAIAIVIGDVQLSSSQILGDGLALLSALFLSAFLLAIENLRSRLATPVILLTTSTIGAVVTGAIALQFEHQLFPVSSRGWSAVIGLALVSQVLGQGLITYSLNRLSSGVVALSYLLEPVLSALAAWVLFAETLSVFNLAAFMVVILGIYMAISSQSAVKEAAVIADPAPVEAEFSSSIAE